MAPKKKRNKKPNGTAAKKSRRTLRRAGVSKTSVKKKSANKKSVQKRAASRPKARTRKQPSVSAETEVKREFQRRSLTAAGAMSRQPSDFKGLSRREQADSESVNELVEEGNVFEAGAVAGVEKADDADEREVHTQELPEDDIPEEYLDKE